jgi:hypothetical protein
VAVDVEVRRSESIGPMLRDPEIVRLHRVVDDYEGMRRDGVLDTLPESALRAIQSAVSEAQETLSRTAPGQLERRKVEVPLLVSATVGDTARGSGRVRIDLVAPIPLTGVAGPVARLVARLARGVRDLAEYLDLPLQAVRFEQRGTLAGAAVFAVEAPGRQGLTSAEVSETTEVLLDSAIADDDEALLPVLLHPLVREVPEQIVKAVLAQLTPLPPPTGQSVTEGDHLSLETAATRLRCSPVELAVRLALIGLPLGDDGVVDPGALNSLRGLEGAATTGDSHAGHTGAKA